MLLLKSHEPLFSSKVPVMGDSQAETVANGFMLTPPDSNLLLKWLIEYKTYQSVKQNWDWYSVRKLWSLWRGFPDDLRVLSGQIVRPGFNELDLIFRGEYNWLNSYNVHIYKR